MPSNRTVGYTFLAKDQFTAMANRISSAMDKIGTSTKKTTAASRNATTEQERLGKLISGNFKRMVKAAAGAAAGAASIATLRHVLNETATVEDAINKVLSLIRDPADQAKYKSKIEAIIVENQRLGRSAAEIGEALFLQVSQMGANEQSFASFSESVKLAIGGFADMQASVTGVNKVLENYPQLAGNAKLAANILNAAQRSGSTNVQEMALALPDVLSVGSSQKVKVEELAATVAILSKALKSTGGAAVATRGLILALAQPDKEAAARLRRVGIEPTPQEIERIGFVGQLRKLTAVLQARPDLAKKLVPNTEGLVGAAKLDKATLDAIERVAAEAQDDYAKGLGLEASFQRVQESASSDMAKSREAMNELSVVIGRELAPSVKVIATTLRDWNLPQGQRVDRALGIEPGSNPSALDVLLRAREMNRAPKAPLATGVQGE